MWSNLLSGLVGSIVGLVGAVLVAVLTVKRAAAREHEDSVQRIEAARENDAAGRMAVPIVAIFDALKSLSAKAARPTREELDALMDLVDNLRRAVVIDGPLVKETLETELKAVRKAIATAIDDADATPVTTDKVAALLDRTDRAGKQIQSVRRPTTGGE